MEEDVVVECRASLDEMRNNSIPPIENTFYSFSRGHILEGGCCSGVQRGEGEKH
jgi:hypothetical protein